jgi:hypothetical protein
VFTNAGSQKTVWVVFDDLDADDPRKLGVVDRGRRDDQASSAYPRAMENRYVFNYVATLHGGSVSDV